MQSKLRGQPAVVLVTLTLVLVTGIASLGFVVAERAESRATAVLLCRMKFSEGSGVDVQVSALDALQAVVSQHPPPLRLHVPWTALAEGAATKLAGSNSDFKGTITADDDGLVVEQETRFGEVRAELDATIEGSVLDLSVSSVTVGGRTLSGALVDGMVGSTKLPSADLAEALPRGAEVTEGRVGGNGVELDLSVNREALAKLNASGRCRG